MHPSPTAETLMIHTIQHRMCVTCVYLRGQASVGSFRSSKSPSLTNLCMHLFTRSLTTLRERTIRQMCPPWPRLPPRMAPRSTFFPSQRSLCPSPNNLADPVRDHRCCLQIGPAFHFAKLLFMFSCCPFLLHTFTPANTEMDRLYVKTVAPQSRLVLTVPTLTLTSVAFVPVIVSSEIKHICLLDSSQPGTQQV